MRKILYLLHKYPQISETYMETEIRALNGRFQIEIITTGEPDVSYAYHHDYITATSVETIIEAARKLDPQPDMIHSHYMNMVPVVMGLAKSLDVPFTIRSHSFDVFPPASHQLSKYAPAINSDYCAGLLGFPPVLKLFDQAGYDMSKITPCFPIIEYDWFYDVSPNGKDINTVEEASKIIAGDVPEEIRNQGFIQAGKSDIHSHIDKLVNFWRKAY